MRSWVYHREWVYLSIVIQSIGGKMTSKAHRGRDGLESYSWHSLKRERENVDWCGTLWTKLRSIRWGDTFEVIGPSGPLWPISHKQKGTTVLLHTIFCSLALWQGSSINSKYLYSSSRDPSGSVLFQSFVLVTIKLGHELDFLQILMWVLWPIKKNAHIRYKH